MRLLAVVHHRSRPVSSKLVDFLGSDRIIRSTWTPARIVTTRDRIDFSLEDIAPTSGAAAADPRPSITMRQAIRSPFTDMKDELERLTSELKWRSSLFVSSLATAMFPATLEGAAVARPFLRDAHIAIGSEIGCLVSPAASLPDSHRHLANHGGCVGRATRDLLIDANGDIGRAIALHLGLPRSEAEAIGRAAGAAATAGDPGSNDHEDAKHEGARHEGAKHVAVFLTSSIRKHGNSPTAHQRAARLKRIRRQISAMFGADPQKTTVLFAHDARTELGML